MAALAAIPLKTLADPFPPVWQNGAGSAVHYRPVAWPASPANPANCGPTCEEWRPYQAFSTSINDPRTQDPSNGGTLPQNYVNIASSCIDKNYPSVYYAVDTANEVLFFRWRVEQIANSYAVGPSAGSYASTDPWKSAQWTVFFDLNGDGYRELAAHLNGSSGDPANAIDRLVGVWGEIPNQSTDYINDPNIHLLAHNPTGFVDAASSRILNFHNLSQPNALWQNGSAETVWDYGTSRATRITGGGGCEEFFIDYQIPLDMLDATAIGGPKLTLTTPFSMLFCTANSLNNPMQKDCAYEGEWTAGPQSPAPFGDTLILQPPSPDPDPEPMTLPQPLVQDIRVESCRPAQLSARVGDALYVDSANNAISSLLDIDFYYYFDANANGQPDDAGSDWLPAASGRSTSPGVWTAAWDSTSAPNGQLLIGLQAADQADLNPDGKVNRTFSYYTDVNDIPGYPSVTENWHVNPTVDAVMHWTTFANACGSPSASLTKTVSPASVNTGETVDFTLTFNNTGAAPVTISRIEDELPAGFSYVTAVSSDLGGTLALAPSPDDTGTLVWTFSPAGSVSAGGSATLVFRARVPDDVGVYANTARAVSSQGELYSDPAEVAVGEPSLSLQLTGSPVSVSPGDQIVYTHTYSNDNSVNLTGVILTDLLPDGVTFVSATGGGTYNPATNSIAWDIGDLPAGSGPFTVTITVTVPSDYPETDPNPLVDSATIDSTETASLDRSTSTYVVFPSPMLSVQKEANVREVAPGGTVIFTVRYANPGIGVASDAVVTDVVPVGFTYIDAQSTAACSLNAGTVSCPVGDLASGASGSVQIAMQAADPYTVANPQTNTATLASGALPTATSSTTIGVTQPGCANTTYYLHSLAATGLPAPVGLPATPDGQKFLANSSMPTSIATIGPFEIPNTGVETEIAHFYQDPAQTSSQTFGTLTQYFYISKTGANPISVAAYVYSYNSTTGAVSQIGTGFSASNNGQYTNELFSFSVTPTAPLNPGDRLLWRITATNTNQPNSFSLHVNTNPASLTRVISCVSSANLSFDKTVDKTLAAPGDLLQYTLRFSNSGNMAATGATIADTLPGDATFISAELNGAPATAQTIVGNTYTYQVNSAGAAAGTIAAGASGALVITAQVNSPLPAGAIPLTNSAVLDAAEALPLTDTADTTVINLQPNVIISKSVDRTMLVPGNIATYSLTVTNIGEGPAADVTITDGLPESAYYEYVAGSAALDGAPLVPDPVSGGALIQNIGALLAGESATLTFEMRALGGLPAGIIQLDNQASVTDASNLVPRESNTVSVLLNANPILRLYMAVSPSSGTGAGDELAYTLTAENVGGGPAQDLLILDGIPEHANYIAGSLVAAGQPQTDARDADNGEFDPGLDRVSFHAATLAAGDSYVVQFRVRVGAPLETAVTPILNTGSAGASNAATQTAAVSTDAGAAPLLTLEKTGPATIALPAARLAEAAAGDTIIALDDASQLSTGQYLRINGVNTRITSIAGTTVAVDTPVTGAAGDQVFAGAVFTLTYANAGSLTATGVVLEDELPPLMVFAAASDGGVFSLNTVTWSLPDLPPGASGAVRVMAIPTAAATYVNVARLDCVETPEVTDTHSLTAAGGLTVTKAVSISPLRRGENGVTAEWTIAVRNTSDIAAVNVSVTDHLPQGFTYTETVSTTGARTGVINPTAGDQNPTWGAWTISSGAAISITFRASAGSSIAPGVYLNDVSVSSDNVDSFPYDPFSHPEGQVEVTVSSLEGLVWRDDNSNAHIDPIEWPLRDVTITIYAENNQVVATLRSGPFGGFQIDNLQPGSYRVAVAPPSGATNTTPLSVWVIIPEEGVAYANFGLLSPTAVTMSAPYARTAPGRTTIAWSTQVEVDVRGFNVYRAMSLTGARTLVNTALIPARCAGSLEPCDYTLEDPAAAPGVTYYYWVEVIDAGVPILSDPIEVTPLYGYFIPIVKK